jgi:cytoskeletal protein RodZ
MKVSRSMVLAILAVLIVGVGGWIVAVRQRAETPKNVSTQNATCNADSDLCAFFATHKAKTKTDYTVTSLSEAGTQHTEMTLQFSGKDVSFKLSGTITYEVIRIGDKTTYTKTPDGTWWKFTETNDTLRQYLPSAEAALPEPTANNADTVTYKALGKEACGALQCFKYELTTSTEKGTVITLWFDEAAHVLRRTVTTNAASTYDASYVFAPVDIAVPSPVKDLKKGEFVGPNQSEPLPLLGRD